MHSVSYVSSIGTLNFVWDQSLCCQIVMFFFLIFKCPLLRANVFCSNLMFHLTGFVGGRLLVLGIQDRPRRPSLPYLDSLQKVITNRPILALNGAI